MLNGMDLASQVKFETITFEDDVAAALQTTGKSVLSGTRFQRMLY
jgi:hypothetical protein